MELTGFDIAVLRVLAERGTDARPLNGDVLYRSLPVEHQLSPRLYNKMGPLLSKGLVLARTMRPARRTCYSITPEGVKALEGRGRTSWEKVQIALDVLEAADRVLVTGIFDEKWGYVVEQVRELGYNGRNICADAILAFAEGVLVGAGHERQ